MNETVTEALGHPKPEAGTTGRRLRLLVPYISMSSFIQRDIEILRSRHEVVLVPCRPLWKIPAAALRCLTADGVYCWFGSTRFLPIVLVARLAGRKVVVITGGYDVANVPDIQYGNMRSGLTRLLGRLLFRIVDVVACYSKAAAGEAILNAGVPPERLKSIYLGFNGGERRQVESAPQKLPMVLTVSLINASTIDRKGLLAVVQTARLLPEVPFVIVGGYESSALARLKALAGPNVSFTGYVTDAELNEWYSNAKVYFQPSLHEAFGCSVAEAMLHNCTPVVTRRSSLPEVVGDSGYYVDVGDYEKMAAVIRRALADAPPGLELPRNRILREFPESKRRAAILDLLESVYA